LRAPNSCAGDPVKIGRTRMLLPGRAWRPIALTAALLCALSTAPAVGASNGGGDIRVIVRGLPPGQPALMRVEGAAVSRVVRVRRRTIRGLLPGVYEFSLLPVVIRREARGIHRGAVAYPAKGRLQVTVTASHSSRVTATYTAIVNPRVVALSTPVVETYGIPGRPRALLLPPVLARPAIGTVLTSGPTPQLPFGLIAKVKRTRPIRRGLMVWLAPVTLPKATPEFAFTGHLPLAPTVGTGARSRAHASNTCAGPHLLQFGAHLDAVEVRHAFLGAWPPQLELTLAVRTTEWLGVAAAAAGIKCSWSLGELGPYEAAVPLGPVVVPVYATIPVSAYAHIDGRLTVGSFNVASTTVAQVAAGFARDEAKLAEQGSNVWISGSPSISGSAALSASITVQAGVGVAKVANVHVQAGFGPKLDWSTGHNCNLVFDLGSLSGGVTAFGTSLNTPAFTPLKLHVWSGCASPPPPVGQPPQPPPTAPPSNPPPTSTQPPVEPPQPPPPPANYNETTGGETHTWTNYTNAGGYEGPTIPSNATVAIACKLSGFRVEDGNTWWYRIASSPWNGAYYASADAFYNNGQTSGSLKGTPFFDPNIPNC
jgi:hypothetical protein